MLREPKKSIILTDRPGWKLYFYPLGLMKLIFTVFGLLFFGWIGLPVGFLFGCLMDMKIEEKKQPMGKNEMGITFMLLATAVMKSGGPVNDEVKRFTYKSMAHKFGVEYVRQRLVAFEHFHKQQIDVTAIAMPLQEAIPYEEKMQLMYFLFGVASRDTNPGADTLRLLSRIADAIVLKPEDFSNMLGLHWKMDTSPYDTLEVRSDATFTEIKKSYLRLAKLHHPDRVAHLGATAQQHAKVRFQEIQAAYLEIQKLRGIA